MEKLGWAPSIKLADGFKVTFEWISEKIEEEKKAGNDVATLDKSTICGTMTPTKSGALRKDGEEELGK